MGELRPEEHKRGIAVVYSSRRRIGAMVVAVISAFAGTAVADVKKGVDAWAEGNFEAAVQEWRAPAAAGDPDAQFNLAQAHKLGRGVPRDLAKAEALYAAAAAQGHLEASDAYGLMLFQRGEREKAMPYIRAAAGRGDPRAQYIHGLTLFNGDGVEKDWVRAYAYLSLAQQAGLPQATTALAQMDQHIPMTQRQSAVVLAGQIATDTEATRARQLAAFDLESPSATSYGSGRPLQAQTASAAITKDAAAGARHAPPPIVTAPPADEVISPATGNRATATAGRGEAASKTSEPRPARKPAPEKSGPWQVQLGAFGIKTNADALWQRVKSRPELEGRSHRLVTSGKLTKLQATGFATEGAANAACERLKKAEIACLAMRD